MLKSVNPSTVMMSKVHSSIGGPVAQPAIVEDGLGDHDAVEQAR
jgi:hypothetical protein